MVLRLNNGETILFKINQEISREIWKTLSSILVEHLLNLIDPVSKVIIEFLS